jgi:hypothetical protein
MGPVEYRGKYRALTVRFTPVELVGVTQRAAAAGLSVASYLRTRDGLPPIPQMTNAYQKTHRRFVGQCLAETRQADGTG